MNRLICDTYLDIMTMKRGLMSKFFCDTNSDLWFTIADELGLQVIGMPYSIDGEEIDYDLGRNTDFKSFYSRLAAGADAKTQALNKQNYLDYFEPVLAAGEDIIYVHFSRKMSGTFLQMDQAIQELQEKYPNRKISTVDTGLISLGEALLVYDAALMWKNGATDQEIVQFVENNRNKYAMYFTVKDLGQLKRGGRLSAVSFVAGTLLNIKPIIRVDDTGALNKFSTAKGMRAGIKAIVARVKEIGTDLENGHVIVADADAKEQAEELVNALREACGSKLEIWRWSIGPTVGAHCGCGTVGVAFHAKSR